MRPARHLLVALVLLLSATPAFATPEIAKQTQRWTFMLEVDGRLTGTAIAAGRHAWTAAHCIYKPEGKYSLRTIDDVRIPVEVLAVSGDGYDLAVLELPDGVSVAGPSWHPSKVGVGDRIYVCGCPVGRLEMPWTVTQGMISFLGRDLRKITDYWQIPLDQFDCSVWYGNSGGGAYEQATGHLVGMVVARDPGTPQGYSFMVPVRRMVEWASKHKLQRCVPPPPPEPVPMPKCKDCCK